MNNDVTYLGLMARLILINVVPFVLVFQLVMKRRKQLEGDHFSELKLIAGEIQTVGILGYFIILSIFFFSIPVVNRYHPDPGYQLVLIQPDNTTVFLIAYISYALVVVGLYLQYKRIWAYRSALFLTAFLLVYAFFNILEIGAVAVVPIVLFSYLLFRLTRASLKSELYSA